MHYHQRENFHERIEEATKEMGYLEEYPHKMTRETLTVVQLSENSRMIVKTYIRNDFSYSVDFQEKTNQNEWTTISEGALFDALHAAYFDESMVKF